MYFLAGIFGGFIAWITTAIVAQPLSGFLALRSQAAKVLARYEERVDYDVPSEEYNPDWVQYRRQEYVACGNDLIAFEAAHAFIAKALRRLPHNWRCYPNLAGANFVTLANLRPAEYQAQRTRNIIVAALKLRFPRQKRKS